MHGFTFWGTPVNYFTTKRGTSKTTDNLRQSGLSFSSHLKVVSLMLPPSNYVLLVGITSKKRPIFYISKYRTGCQQADET